MARVIGPNGVPIQGIASSSLPRASGNDFGAQVGRATQQVGAAIGDAAQALEGYANAQKKLEEQRKGAEDGAFLDAADLELDTGYAKAFNDETSRARSGAEKMTDTLTSRLENDTASVRERLTERGFRPSEEALQKFEQLKLRRQHQYISKSIAYENNERIRLLGDQLGQSIEATTARAVQAGDVKSGIERIEQSIEAYRGIVPAPELDKMRQKAAAEFVRNLKENADVKTLDSLATDLFGSSDGGQSSGKPSPAQGAAAAAGREEAKAVERKPAQSRFAGSVGGAISEAASEAGVDAGLLDTFARIESGGKPGARTGSYKGLFQLSESEFEKYGGGDIYDPKDNARAAARKLKAEAAEFEKRTGRAPDAVDLYMVHQQGEAGYAAHMRRPGAPAWQNMASTREGRQKGAGWAKRAIWGNIPDDMKARFGSVDNVTSEDFIGLWREKVGRFGGGRVAMAQGTLEEPSMRGAFARELAANRGDIAARANALREKEADAERAKMLIAGAIPVDPGSADDRKVVDKAWAASDLSDKLQAGDPAAAESVVKLAQETSYIPQGAMQSLRGMAVNGDATQKIYSYQTVGRIMRERPGATGADKDFEADVTRFNTLVMDLGMTPQGAISKIEETRTPEFQKAKKVLSEEGTKLAKDITVADITAKHDGWFSSEPGFINDRQKAEVQEAYREAFRMNYVETGDSEWAKKAAQNQIAQIYSTSSLTGRKVLMREPPEKYYPPIASRANGKPSMDYFTDDLKQTVRELAGKEIGLDQIIIRSGPTTFGDIASGKTPPSYDIGWIDTDENGIPAIRVAPRPFFVDVKAAKAKEADVRKKALEDRREGAVYQAPNVDPTTGRVLDAFGY